MNKLIWSILFYCCTLRVCGQENTFTYVVIDSVRHVEMCIGWDTTRTEGNVGISKYHHPAIPVDTKGRIVIPSKVTNENGKTCVLTSISRAGLQGCKELTEVVLPEVEGKRYLVKIPKVRPTPAGYPRRTGLPLKKPIL